jgi:hypothetical protein
MQRSQEVSVFKKYMHLERFGNEEVEGIELGRVFVFPKIDGTNASYWMCDPKRNDWQAGSRTRVLSESSDNAGFWNWCAKADESIPLNNFITKYPHLRLYGEWLVPHTFKDYRPDAWRKFYIFDVYNDETEQYISYETYKPLLDEFELTHIPPLAIVNNGDYTRFMNYLEQNKYLCPDDGSPGEGIVLKNYDFYNKFGRQCWAKIIRQEFKEAHYHAMGAPEVNEAKMNEERILDKALTDHLVDKTLNKITVQRGGWRSQYIPELFERLFYDIVKEELWDSLKDINHGTVNFKTLKAMMIMQVKQMRKELF